MASGSTITSGGMTTMTQAVAGTDTVAPADFNNARTNVNLLLGTAADVTLGTMTLADGEVTFIMKDPTDQIFAAAATVLGTPVKYS